MLILSDNGQLRRQLREALDGYGFEVRCSTHVHFQSLLKRLDRRPKVLIVDTPVASNVLRRLATMLESHDQLQGCAWMGLGNGDKANNTPLPFHRRMHSPCEPVEILALVTRALEYHVPDEPTATNARVVV